MQDLHKALQVEHRHRGAPQAEVEEAQGLQSDFDYYLEGRTSVIYICRRHPSTTVSGYPINRNCSYYSLGQQKSELTG